MELPTLPQAFVDVAMPAPRAGATTHSCTTAAEFVTALANAVLGDIIELEAGATFRLTTQTFTLANKTPAAHSGNPDNSEWIVIRSSLHASLPPEGTRVTSADAANMAKLVADADVYSCLITSPGAHHYRFVGLEMTNPATTNIQSLVRFGNNPQEEEIGDFTHHLVIDRCYIHKQNDGSSVTYGLNIHANQFACVDSEVSQIISKSIGAGGNGNDQSSACQLNGFGPYKIHNNAMSSGCGILGGGGIVNIVTDQIPSDMTITNNHFYRDPAWDGTVFKVGQGAEWKKGQRMLYEHNIFENFGFYADTQQINAQYALIFAASNGNGTSGDINPWDFVGDVTIRYNIFRHVPIGIAICRWIVLDPPYYPQPSARFHIHDNLFYHLFGAAGGDAGNAFELKTGPIDVIIEHNTIQTTWTQLLFIKAGLNADNFIFRNNIMSAGGYIVNGESVFGDDTLYSCASGFVFDHNVIWGTSPQGVTIGHFYDSDAINWFADGGLTPAPTTRSVIEFVNPWDSGGDAGISYQLQATSPYKGQATDSTDVGVRWNLFHQANRRVLIRRT